MLSALLIESTVISADSVVVPTSVVGIETCVFLFGVDVAPTNVGNEGGIDSCDMFIR